MIASTIGRAYAPPLVFALFALLAGCKDLGENPPVSTPPVVVPDTIPTRPPVSFRNDVLKKVFESTRAGCLGCHGGTNGLFLGTQPDILRGGIHGPAVVPGNSAQSLLVRKISANPPFGDRMPFGGFPLPDSLVQIVKDWIDQGALDN